MRIPGKLGKTRISFATLPVFTETRMSFRVRSFRILILL